MGIGTEKRLSSGRSLPKAPISGAAVAGFAYGASDACGDPSRNAMAIAA